MLDNNKYTHSEGSTIITLDKDYLNSLDDGTHQLKVFFYYGGRAEASFTVKTKEENTGEQTVVEESVNNPATSDNVISYIIMLFLSTIGLLSIFLNKKITN